MAVGLAFGGGGGGGPVGTADRAATSSESRFEVTSEQQESSRMCLYLRVPRGRTDKAYGGFEGCWELIFLLGHELSVSLRYSCHFHM